MQIAESIELESNASLIESVQSCLQGLTDVCYLAKKADNQRNSQVSKPSLKRTMHSCNSSREAFTKNSSTRTWRLGFWKKPKSLDRASTIRKHKIPFSSMPFATHPQLLCPIRQHARKKNSRFQKSHG